MALDISEVSDINVPSKTSEELATQLEELNGMDREHMNVRLIELAALNLINPNDSKYGVINPHQVHMLMSGRSRMDRHRTHTVRAIRRDAAPEHVVRHRPRIVRASDIARSRVVRAQRTTPVHIRHREEPRSRTPPVIPEEERVTIERSRLQRRHRTVRTGADATIVDMVEYDSN